MEHSPHVRHSLGTDHQHMLSSSISPVYGQIVACLQVYTHHFVTVDTLMVPPPTGQGLMVRPAFSEQHRLLVPANMLESEISR